MKKLISAAIACVVISPLVHADQVIFDDLIVDGSQCVGLDCVEGENFDFDTIRLKENNIPFKDGRGRKKAAHANRLPERHPFLLQPSASLFHPCRLF